MADQVIPEEMVEKAALEMHDQSCPCEGSERCRQSALYPPGVLMQTARAILSAALAGRQIVDLPEPDAHRSRLDGGVDVWNIDTCSVTANTNRVAILNGRDGIGDGMAFYADRARQIAAALIAGADRVERAAGSGGG